MLLLKKILEYKLRQWGDQQSKRVLLTIVSNNHFHRILAPTTCLRKNYSYLALLVRKILVHFRSLVKWKLKNAANYSKSSFHAVFTNLLPRKTFRPSKILDIVTGNLPKGSVKKKQKIDQLFRINWASLSREARNFYDGQKLGTWKIKK